MANTQTASETGTADIKKALKQLSLDDLKEIKGSCEDLLRQRALAELEKLHEHENDLRLMAGLKRKPGGTGKKK